MNHRLGFGKTTADYLDFIDSCEKFSDTTCKSLQNIVKYFVQNVKPGRVTHTLGSEYGGPVYHDLHQLIDSGTIHFPDSIRQISSSWYNNYSIGMSHFCASNGYIAEVRFKFLRTYKTGDVFYSNLGDTIISFVGQRYTSGPNLGLSIYIGSLRFLLDTNANRLLDWMTFKMKILPTEYYIYYSDSLIYHNSHSKTLRNFSNFGMGLFNRDGCIDWIKISDTLGNVKYFEDYNNADYPATVDTSFICPAPANCQTSFVNYFNQSRGTSYTYTQIDSVYLINCGTSPNICSTNTVQDTIGTSALFGPRLCGKAEPVFPSIIPKQWGPCDDSTNFALIKGTQLYNVEIDSLNDVFNNAYIKKCMAAQKLENFTVLAPVSEYHYTLYYYGQAGNLIKTVPPQGVDLSKFSVSNWSATVATARKNNQVAIPNHTLFTVYRYNTLNQVVAQITPDAGRSLFWYDRLGRLVISQDTLQRYNGTENGRKYSYTLYDNIGRITEVGEYINPSTTAMSDQVSRGQSQLTSWLGTQANKSQITSTVYDLEYPGWVAGSKQVSAKNLRNRVAYTTYTIGSNPANFNTASFYSYDISGNVDTLIQDYGNSLISGNENIMNLNNNRWQKMVFRYDLISGKVNAVTYQPQYTAGNTLYRRNDAFYHKYEYDAENRLTTVYTSTDSIIWEKDARYEYYKHGPLARTILGDQLVQGIDYAYTLQGWLKGVNSISLLSNNDMGQDGNTVSGQNQNQFIGKDAFGFNLNYFTGDYSSINNAVTPFPGSSAYLNTTYRPLYNGNISSMAVNINNLTIPGGTANAGGAMLYNYKYDQLNRITAMDAYTGFANNQWNGLTLKTEYQERVAYDANGNILKYLRNGNKSGSSLRMDSLSYKYNANTNQLNYVKDNVTATTYSSPDADVDGQSADNYIYYFNGNLYKDNAEKITAIYWNVYNKITAINFSNTTNGTTKNIYYFYDASQNRVGSRVEKNSSTGTTNSVYTWYVRDASGNVMATYNSTATGNSYPYNLVISEKHLYGSSRLGILNSTSDVRITPTSGITSGYNSSFIRGNKYYELSNHLGNVLATISDKKIGHDGGSGVVDYYNANVISAQDYYPFGMQMPGRKYAATSSKYRYGFNGKENDNDVKGDGNQQDYGMRIYDPRIGKFFSIDPLNKSYPELTPYQFASNTPIQAVDLDGLEAKVTYKNSYINQSRTAITVKASVEINVQIINLSSQANKDLNLDEIKSNLQSDLETKLGGINEYTVTSPYTFGKSLEGIAPLDSEHPGNFNFDVTYDVGVSATVSVITDKSQINPSNTFIFGIVDKVSDSKEAPNTAGVAYGIASGKVALGEARNFDYANAGKNGKNLIFHEILHLLGAEDINNNPNKKGMTNAMNSLDKNDGSLTNEQIVKEVWTNTIGSFWNIGIQEQKKSGYKQPLGESHKEDTKKQLEKFVEKQE